MGSSTYSNNGQRDKRTMSRERMNSSPEYMGPGQGGFRPRMRRRTMSIENTSLTEVITIYEKLKKSREHESIDVFRPSTTHFGFDIEESDFDESVPLEPFTANIPSPFYCQANFEEVGLGIKGVLAPSSDPPLGTAKLLDFNKFKGIKSAKYLYFSASTGLIQAPSLDELKFTSPYEKDAVDLNYVKLLKSKHYWLNIIDPSEKDLALLSSAFSVHDLTLRDIREGNTEEKIEVYKHYMFISLRLLSESDTSSQKTHKKRGQHHSSEGCGHGDSESVYLHMAEGEEGGPERRDSVSSGDSSDEKDPVPFVEDVDFNILLFSDFIITVHDKHWNSIKDVLGFLSLLCTYGNSILTPDWVLFSIFIELGQDAKYSVAYMEPKILNWYRHPGTEPDIDQAYVNALELSRTLRRNFEYEFEIYKITRFVKPKMHILKLIKLKCNKRLSGTVIKLLSNICSELEELLDELNHFSHILERSQDTFLTMASVQQSLMSNDMGKVMKRISEVALIFLPVQAIGGFVGMNVRVPFQTSDDDTSTLPFWIIVMSSLTIATCLYLLRKFILNQRSFQVRCLKCKNR